MKYLRCRLYWLDGRVIVKCIGFPDFEGEEGFFKHLNADYKTNLIQAEKDPPYTALIETTSFDFFKIDIDGIMAFFENE